MNRRHLKIPLLFCFVLLSLACSPTKKQSRSISIQLDREPTSLDPVRVEDGITLAVVQNVLDGLVGYTPDGKLENRLAESYNVSADGKRLEFTLRKGVRWSDGKEVIAEHFVAALRRALGPQSLCKQAPHFMKIRGAKAFREGKGSAQDLGVSGSRRKLIIDLEEPAPHLIHSLTLPAAFPIRAEILAQNNDRWPETAPATGPYRVVEYKLDQEIRLEANPQYWGKPPVEKKIVFKIIHDELTAIHLFEKGQLDILMRISSLDFQRLKKKGVIRTTPFLATFFVSFDCTKPPFNDLKWRQAVAAVIKKTEVTEVLASGEKPASSWVAEGLEGFFEYDEKIPPNFLKAAEEVSKEVRNSGTHKPIEMGLDHSARNQRVFEVIQHNLKSGLGLDSTISQSDWKSYLRTVQANPPPLFRMGWLASVMDPISYLQAFMSEDLSNYSRCKDPRYDRLVNEIVKMEPGPVRKKKIVEAQDILLNEMTALVPLFHYVQNTAVSPRLEGFAISPLGVIRIQQLSRKGD